MGDKIHCNKAEVKPFCCSDGKGGWGSLQILAVIRKIKRSFRTFSRPQKPTPPFPEFYGPGSFNIFRLERYHNNKATFCNFSVIHTYSHTK